MSTQPHESKSSDSGSPLVARILIVGLVFALFAFYLSDLFTR